MNDMPLIILTPEDEVLDVDTRPQVWQTWEQNLGAVAEPRVIPGDVRSLSLPTVRISPKEN